LARAQLVILCSGGFSADSAAAAEVAGMIAERRPQIREEDLKGFKYFRPIEKLLVRLHRVGTARDQAGNRELFCDKYVALLLLYFFNPIVSSMRGLQQASTLAKVQNSLGVGRFSLGSFSEATSVFPASCLRSIVQELAGQALPLEHGREAEALRGLTAVDGTLLPALPRMMWALWQDRQHHAAKMHLHFDVFKGVPTDATLTPGACSEPEQLKATLQSGHFYVIDRGYAGYQLFRDILDAGSSFVGRVKDNTAFTPIEERPLTAEAQAVGVVRDVLVSKLGTDHHKDYLRQTVRLVIVRRLKSNGEVEELWLVTDRLDLDADLVALAYRYRWAVELFFRWFKCILGCRHLLFEDANGVALQAYAALIASLLIVLWTGRKPNKRTWEMMQFYLMGWASEDELFAHLEKMPIK
jgi:Transposase DDE domain